jgi:signal transduction histidine kinase
MLLNFISNAIKFTKPGSKVEVILRAHVLNYPLEEISYKDENLVNAVEEFKKLKYSNES